LIDSPGPEGNEATLTGSDGFIIMPQRNFVAKFGPDYLDVLMKVLDEMTQRFTAKEGIQPIIQKYPEQTLQRLEQWLRDPSPPAWRPVSEGTRPRLPLVPRLPQFIKDPWSVSFLVASLHPDVPKTQNAQTSPSAFFEP
jgi:hypothetical protein